MVGVNSKPRYISYYGPHGLGALQSCADCAQWLSGGFQFLDCFWSRTSVTSEMCFSLGMAVWDETLWRSSGPQKLRKHSMAMWSDTQYQLEGHQPNASDCLSCLALSTLNGACRRRLMLLPNSACFCGPLVHQQPTAVGAVCEEALSTNPGPDYAPAQGGTCLSKNLLFECFDCGELWMHSFCLFRVECFQILLIAR